MPRLFQLALPQILRVRVEQRRAAQQENMPKALYLRVHPCRQIQTSTTGHRKGVARTVVTIRWTEQGRHCLFSLSQTFLAETWSKWRKTSSEALLAQRSSQCSYKSLSLKPAIRMRTPHPLYLNKNSFAGSSCPTLSSPPSPTFHRSPTSKATTTYSPSSSSHSLPNHHLHLISSRPGVPNSSLNFRQNASASFSSEIA